MSDRPLLLIPTALEASRLPGATAAEWDTAFTGVGPVAAAGRTASIIAARRPSRVVLVGIAGTYDPQTHAPGTACTFRDVRIDGVGAGQGDAFIDAPSIGWPYWPGDDETPPAGADPLPLDGSDNDSGLLTVCATAADAEDATRRRGRYPSVAGEDMEGWAVAFACIAAGIPVSIVRGFSNVAGDRRHDRWEIDGALDAAWIIARPLLESSS